ncbi:MULTISPECIES: PepSY domain-containing protein [Bacillaceae]|jgi:predicted small secreted protein|uniref:Peptidase M4 n=1 Tax=Terribacillus saccharophilus TaxID=361277 RepID=A0A1H7Y8I0_9BACI|nr:MULTISPECIES: PepSY domain-containing protein [Bacillaceae]AIF67140.1 peptidase M4 [Terribacillus goriensis]MCM3224095.1 PepSY domain-containing protein [Terribacillus saccharophilus]MEC0284496.1 PepSY domain-containing protein [Terribacillus saccharophilus]MEC0290944.1 PepSY domain-containing protein [Terribacillus saccharophilus]MEC0303457.1 PepSY domain-containing protein [Terribacillus saccharophilus]
MGVKKTVAIVGAGLAAGYLIQKQIAKQQKVTPEKALKFAKEAFKKEGPISGSWIYMKPEEKVKHGLTYTVYRGGISRTIDGKPAQYEFFVDAETGSVIDAVESAS